MTEPLPGQARRVLRSFDVFDTVLTRSVGAPDAVFHVVARHLRDVVGLPVEPATFAKVRAEAAGRVAAARRREPTLAEIYDEVVNALGLPPERAAVGYDGELRCERALSRALPGARAMVDAARESGPVIFLSDTPLPGAFLEQLLRAAHLWKDGDRLLSSADQGATKAKGGALFELAVRQSGVPPAQIHHVGDNAVADVAEARLKGLSAAVAPQGRLNRYEHALESHALASDGLSSFLAGASRLARLEAVSRGTDPEIAAVAAGVAAPMLVGYCAWLVRQAEQRGLRRLYFVSRDAEVMMRVFGPVAAAMGASGIQTRYLYGSRAAWELSSLHRAGPDDVRDRLRGHFGDSTREALFRLGLTFEQVQPQLDSVLPPGLGLDEPLSERVLDRLAGVLGKEPVLSRVRSVAAERHELMLDYLRQEGLATDAASAGLVDVGWMGRTFQALDTVMDEAGFPAVDSFFYVGRSAHAKRWSTQRLAARQRGWLFDQVAHTGVPDQPSGIEAAIEALCTGTEGSLRGYERSDGRVVPVLVDSANRPALDWGLAELRDTIDMVVDELVSGGAPLGRWGDLRGAADAVLRALWLRPTPREVVVWGRFPMDSADDHGAVRGLAVKVTTADVSSQLRAGRLKLRPVFSWRAGTAATSPPPWRQLLQATTWYEAQGPRLRRIPHRVRLEIAARRAGRPT